MKAAIMRRNGGPEVMEYGDYPDPVPAAGEVLVKVAGAGINPVDIAERNGGPGWRPMQFPAVIGWDVSGTVTKLGPGATGLAVGDRVCAWAYHTFAELVAAKAELFAKVPEDVNLVDAGCLPLVGITGSQLISVASGLKPGQTVLVSGAAGGVGRSAVFMAKTMGATVIAGVTKRQLDQAKSIGADQTVALDDEKAFAAIPSVDIVANAVRGKTASQLMSKVKPGGTFASVTGEPEGAKAYPNVHVVAFVSKQDSTVIATIVGAVRSGKLTIPIDRRMPLSEAGKAMAAVAAGANGKIILVP
jgi:NADPH:quinone reductase-like Zn-dependent oxidoreductase